MALQEGKHPGEFLLYSQEKYSREAVTIAAAAGAIVPGTVLGKISATGKYVAYSNVANDGSEVAAGIALYAVPDTAADQKTTIIARHAEVMESELTGIDAAGKADLAALGIICR
jgi:hypothetical protein